MKKLFKILFLIILIPLFFLALTNNVWATSCGTNKGTCVKGIGGGTEEASGLTCPTGQTEDASALSQCTTLGGGYLCCYTKTSPPKSGTSTTGTSGSGSSAATAPSGTGATEVNFSGIKGLGAISPATLIGNLIKTALSIVGALALFMVVYGGIILLTSRGGEGVKKGKDILIWATIGVAVVLGSYALVSYVITGITGGGTSTTGGGTTTTANCAGTCRSISLEGSTCNADEKSTTDTCSDPNTTCCVKSTTTGTCTGICRPTSLEGSTCNADEKSTIDTCSYPNTACCVKSTTTPTTPGGGGTAKCLASGPYGGINCATHQCIDPSICTTLTNCPNSAAAGNPSKPNKFYLPSNSNAGVSCSNICVCIAL